MPNAGATVRRGRRGAGVAPLARRVGGAPRTVTASPLLKKASTPGEGEYLSAHYRANPSADSDRF